MKLTIIVLVAAGCAGAQEVGPVMQPTPVELPDHAPPHVDTSTLYFDPDSDQLDEHGREVLAAIGVWLEESPERRLEVIVNDEAERSRAATAREFLLFMGFDPARVTIVETPRPAPVTGLRTLEIDERDTLVEMKVEPTPSTPIEHDFAMHAEPGEPPGLLRDLGVGISAGAGFQTFLDGEARAVAEPGATWDVRLALGTNQRVALETAYVGSAQEVEALGLDDGAVLLASGVEASLRIVLGRERPLRPYVVAGVGWSRYSIANTETNTSSLADSDEVIQVPLGGGVTFGSRSVLVDLRALIRSTLDEQMLPPTASGEEVDLHSWSLSVRVGWKL